MKLSMNVAVLFIGMVLGYGAFARANEAKKRAFEYVIEKGDVVELKALALALAEEAYKRATHLFTNHINGVGFAKLNETISALETALEPYARNGRFQLAKQYAVDTFHLMMRESGTEKIRLKNNMMKDDAIAKRILSGELAVLNKPYEQIISAMRKKKKQSLIKKATQKIKHKKPEVVHWPEAMNSLTFESLIDHWSEFLMQARLLQPN